MVVVEMVVRVEVVGGRIVDDGDGVVGDGGSGGDGGKWKGVGDRVVVGDGDRHGDIMCL